MMVFSLITPKPRLKSGKKRGRVGVHAYNGYARAQKEN